MKYEAGLNIYVRDTTNTSRHVRLVHFWTYWPARTDAPLLAGVSSCARWFWLTEAKWCRAVASDERGSHWIWLKKIFESVIHVAVGKAKTKATRSPAKTSCVFTLCQSLLLENTLCVAHYSKSLWGIRLLSDFSHILSDESQADFFSLLSRKTRAAVLVFHWEMTKFKRLLHLLWKAQIMALSD